jgi:hypothetical protein
VLHNPHAGKAPINDFTELVELSVEAGKVLTARARIIGAGCGARSQDAQRTVNALSSL